MSNHEFRSDHMNLMNANKLGNGYRIACGKHGDGKPVILIHGTPSHSYIWRNVVPKLVDGACRVFLFDLLGYGASERPADTDVDTSVAGQEAILLQLMSVWNLDTAHFVAHDIGGAIGQRFALSHPERMKSIMREPAAKHLRRTINFRISQCVLFRTSGSHPGVRTGFSRFDYRAHAAKEY